MYQGTCRAQGAPVRTQHLQAAAPAPTFVDNRSAVSLRSPAWANAVVLIDKPLGWTSFDVCAKLKGVLRVKKVCACT